VADPLTILSVSYESRRWLELNLALAARLNPGREPRWLVAENSPPGSANALAPNHGGFHVVPGAPFRELPFAAASYHHGAALNLALAQVETRWLLVLDPDCFIVRPRWIEEVLGHMEEHGAALLGSPWHPRRVKAIRYFPCAHCTFVDLARVPRAALDFLPDELARPRLPKSAWSRVDPLSLRRRRSVGISRDTGWRLQRALAQSGLRVECLQPVYRPSRLRSWVDKAFPDARSLVPKRPGYFTRRGFREAGWPDLDALGWEEFVWRGAPFAFHVRSHPKRATPGLLDSHYERARALLDGGSAAAPR
jgi:hypothetical protein